MVQSDVAEGRSETPPSTSSEKRHRNSKKSKNKKLTAVADDATDNYPAAVAHVVRRSSLSKPGRGERDVPPVKRRKKEHSREDNSRDSRPSSARSSPVIDFDGLSRPSLGTRERLEENTDKAAERLERMKGAVRTLLECVGEDPEREGLLATPERYAQAMLYFTRGYQENAMDIVGFPLRSLCVLHAC